jgi:hypothetical protein
LGSRSRYFFGKITFMGEARFARSEADGNLSLNVTVLGSGASTLATAE